MQNNKIHTIEILQKKKEINKELFAKGDLKQ